MRVKAEKIFISSAAATFLLLGCAVQSYAETVLFQDNFNSGSMSPEWVSKAPTQWVKDGWLHTKDTDGWPRDSMAVVHDSDSSWKDYTVSATAQFVPGTPWEYFVILLRTDNFLRTSGGSSGSAYQLEFVGTAGWPSASASRIVLTRSDTVAGTNTVLADKKWSFSSQPMNIVVSLAGGGISLSVDGKQVFDITDPNPLPFGGVGVHAIWESEARFDNFKVVAEQPVLWNTLSSYEAVHHSVVGPNLTYYVNNPSDPIAGVANRDYVFGPNGHAITIANGSYYNMQRLHNIVLNNAQQYIDPNKGTIQLWYKQNEEPVDYDHGIYRLFGGAYGLGEGMWLHSGVHNGEGLLSFGLEFGGTSVAAYGDNQKPGYNVNENEWIHIRAVWDRNGIDGSADTLRLYAGCKLVAKSSEHGWGNSVGNRIDIAGANDANCAYKFAMSDLMLWDYAKTDWIGIDHDKDGEGDACDPDDDNDAVLDTSDNCPLLSNSGQENNDGDSLGDVCDPDDDNDAVLDTADNCKFTPNADQSDVDRDGQGDACDGDKDGDGIANNDDNCPAAANADQADNDSDGSGDACDVDDDNDGVADDQPDNCPLVANADQADLDGDKIGDTCDIDIDGDGVNNDSDNCKLTVNAAQEDTDSDGAGDACDDDDDNDTVLDAADNCPLIVNADQQDTDHDGQGDVCDGDLDGDGIANNTDNCPNVANGSQNDYDSDGKGDACDDDVDGDGVANASDACALTELNAVVKPAEGCSIDQLCPCEGPRGTTGQWKNHGQYVSCVAKSTESFLAAGLITQAEKDAVCSEAGQSSCGEKK